MVIAESHISMHTFLARGFLSADVYTCKNGINKDFIIKYFKDAFELKDIEHNLIKHGTRYPSGKEYLLVNSQQMTISRQQTTE